MTSLKANAPAKVNLTLHVTGRRDDGYHILDSLVAFANVNDVLTVGPSPNLALSVSGPFSAGVPTDSSNIVLKAAQALKTARGVRAGAAIALEKHLPNAAGLGGGSSDAAAALHLLANFWNVPPLAANAPEVLALGADVPVCMTSPNVMHMRGIGDELSRVPSVPTCAVVLVNPMISVPTAEIFRALKVYQNDRMDPYPEGLDFDGFSTWLSNQRNDLLAPAATLAPKITLAIKKLEAMPKVTVAGMSGSGATCFGLVRSMADARQVARALQVSEMSWWVVPAEIL